jgi:hypothetical protein
VPAALGITEPKRSASVFTSDSGVTIAAVLVPALVAACAGVAASPSSNAPVANNRPQDRNPVPTPFG